MLTASDFKEQSESAKVYINFKATVPNSMLLTKSAVVDEQIVPGQRTNVVQPFGGIIRLWKLLWRWHSLEDQKTVSPLADWFESLKQNDNSSCLNSITLFSRLPCLRGTLWQPKVCE
jgi:hypothetical protein